MIKIIIKKNSLTERKTDVEYGDLSDFLIHLITEKKIKTSLYSKLFEKTKLPFVMISFDQISYQEYIDFVGSNISIIKNQDELNKFLKLQIEIRPKLGDELFDGRMFRNGIMEILYNFGKIKHFSENEYDTIFKKVYGNDLSIFLKDLGDRKGKEILKIFGQDTFDKTVEVQDKIKSADPDLIKTIRRIFSHELGHHINIVRATKYSTKKIGHTAKGGTSQYDFSTKEYARSTEEIQARLTECFTIYAKLLRMKFPDLDKDLDSYIDFGDKYKKLINTVLNDDYQLNPLLNSIRAVTANDPHIFNYQFIELMGASYSGYVDKLNEKTKYRIYKRIHSFFLELKGKSAEGRWTNKYPIFKIANLSAMI